MIEPKYRTIWNRQARYRLFVKTGESEHNAYK